MIKTLINGANGKMGLAIAKIISEHPEYNLQITARRDNGLNEDGEFDLIIDFSSPEGARKAFELAKKRKAALLTGTTNLPQDFIDNLQTEKEIAVFYSPNVSIGVYLFTKLIKEANDLFKLYNKQMHEVHHAQKKDAPSGTAKSLASAVNFPTEEITYERIGADAGTHSLKFTSVYKDEEIDLIHRVLDRSLFAYSAIIIARWLARQTPGFYTMDKFVQGKKE
jgi:4-hydroxy-tetrahydrodipicolinate reductase